MGHTPYSAELCRLAFRNFAICEARMFFRLALAIYDLILQLCEDRASDVGWELLEAYCAMGEEYAVPDDALAKQRNTLQSIDIISWNHCSEHARDSSQMLEIMATAWKMTCSVWS